jgi:transposase
MNAPNFGKLPKKLDNSLSDEYTTIAVDQTRKTVGCDLYHSWFPCGERVTFPFWQHSKQGVKLLGAVTDEQELFATEVVDRFTSDVTIRFLRALQDEFGEKIHVLLDNASYFKSQQVRDFVQETQIEVTYFPRGSPDLNPVEECWRQLKRTLGNRFFTSIDELRPAMTAALDQINPPQITDYLRRSV